MTGNNLLGLPALFVFGLLAYVIIRSRRVMWFEVTVFVLFGFYLGESGFARFVSGLVSLVTHWVGGSS